MQKKKLTEAQTLMAARISSMGIDPDEAMKSYRDISSKVKLPEQREEGTADASPAPTDKVKIQSPDGETRLVDKSAVEKYVKMGGKVVP